MYIEAMTEDIALAARMLALGVETEVPECGLFEPLKVSFRDKSGRLDITDWWLRVFSLGSLEGCDKTENRRCLELVGGLPGWLQNLVLSFLRYEGGMPGGIAAS